MSSVFSSIKFKLIAYFLSAFLLVLLALGIFLNDKLETMVIGSVDSHLHSEVQLLTGLMKVEDGILNMELTEAEVGDYAMPLSGHYYQILSSSGEVLGRSPSLYNVDAYLPILGPGTVPAFESITGPRKLPLRMLSETFDLPGGIKVVIQASESLEDSFEVLGLFRRTLWVLFPSLFVVSGLGMFIIVGWSLRSVKDFSREIGEVTEKNLNKRIEEDTASELRPLAENFNTMLTRLESSFEKQKEFFSDASHELRTPAAIIRSTCDVTLNKPRSEDEYKESLKSIAATSKRLGNLIDRVLEVARFDSKAYSLNLSMVNVKELVGDVLKLFEPAFTVRGISTSLEGVSRSISVDREKLTEILTNVIDNAVKYNRENGSVDIRITEDDEYLIVSVIDTGMGMNEAEKEKAFERFYRADKSRESTEGTGLGLSIVKAMVEAHSGRIEIESEVGRGTTFKIFLPARDR
ncbi:MAG: HAMP domain-containing protein [Deltaproteobacteria bacterium]|nr:HAMP domain-containing protein [Deltaproteobacteria bacterium]